MAVLELSDRFVSSLPGDDRIELGRHPRQSPGMLYSLVEPTPTAAPQVIAISNEMLLQLGLSEADVAQDWFKQLVSGNLVLDGMQPFAMRYGGHQFGNWAGQLGDGRAINLGEATDIHGVSQSVQLKGAGKTPYSRTADGLAVLRSSVREFLCSEAMFHLGVPTTRALSLSLTGDQVMRDMLYDGHPALEPGAIVARISPSFIRFGHFELLAAGGEIDELTTLVGFVLTNHFPELVDDPENPVTPDAVVELFRTVVRRTAEMIVHWQRVGFVHGVMNTDNLSILGLTIDYGPYGWLEDYDPNWTPNTTDKHGKRYRFGNQPGIGQWNLAQLGNALFPLVQNVEPLQDAIDEYVTHFRATHNDMMAAKLGFAEWQGPDDEALMVELTDLLAKAETDMTIFYRRLADVQTGQAADPLVTIADAFYEPEAQLTDELRSAWHGWFDQYIARIRTDDRSDQERQKAMNAVNPLYVMRNYLAQLAIDRAAGGDFDGITELLDTMRRPYDEQPGREHLAEKRPDWARTRVGCSMLSCSS